MRYIDNLWNFITYIDKYAPPKNTICIEKQKD